MKLIFVNPNLDPRIHITKCGDYEHSEKHNGFIWQGRELDPKEFNEVCRKVMEDARHAWPHGFIFVRAIEEENANVDLNAEIALWKERAISVKAVAQKALQDLRDAEHKLANTDAITPLSPKKKTTTAPPPILPVSVR